VVASVPLPRLLAESVARSAEPGRTEWLHRLPEIVVALADRWSLTVGAPFEPGGEVSWVAPVRDAAGRELVLKVGWTHDEGRHEA
jgi:streptomycin 6-kinase